MIPSISVVELQALWDMAEKIVSEAFETGSPNFNTNYARTDQIADLRLVTVAPKAGNIDDVGLIEARCIAGQAIQVKLAYGGIRAGSRRAREGVARTVFGALVHELIHVRQCKADPVAFKRSSELQALSDVGVNRDPETWVSSYYGDPLECEAHGTQLAAELEKLGIRLEREDLHGRWVETTEVSRRIYSRLFPAEGDAADEVIEWWSSFVERVKAIQASWTSAPCTTATNQGDPT